MLLRTTLLSLLVASAASAQAPTPVRAPVAARLAPLPLQDVPAQCKAIGQQANSAGVQVALSARISLANCLADVKLAGLKLLDCEESVLAVDEAVKPSFEILDGVIAAGDDPTKILGEQAKAELYNQMTLRMRQTLGAPGTTESQIALFNVRKDLLEGLLGKWKDAAFASYERIVLAVKAKPALEKNPVVATAHRTAKDRLRAQVASAAPAPAKPAPEAPTSDAPASDAPASSTSGGGGGGGGGDGAKTDTSEALR